ncbi:unnamed protein product [Lampetra planeri]
MLHRSLPAARHRLLAALNGASVPVRAACALLLAFYALSFVADTPFALGVSSGYLAPPNFWVWTLVTHPFVEVRAIELAASLVTVAAAGRLLEPLWGALELLLYFGVSTVASGVLCSITYLFVYVASSFDTYYLFWLRVHGMAGFSAAVLVALKQTQGEAVLARWPVPLRARHLPSASLALLVALRLLNVAESRVPLAFAYGGIAGWLYLRFYQRHPGAAGAAPARGDPSEHFAFASFFPPVARGAVDAAAGALLRALVHVGVCRGAGKRYTVEAPSSVTISLPGIDAQDAERRRQLALKALNERLRQSEEQTAWPAMDEAEEVGVGGPKEGGDSRESAALLYAPTSVASSAPQSDAVAPGSSTGTTDQAPSPT